MIYDGKAGYNLVAGQNHPFSPSPFSSSTPNPPPPTKEFKKGLFRCTLTTANLEKKSVLVLKTQNNCSKIVDSRFVYSQQSPSLTTWTCEISQYLRENEKGRATVLAFS